MVDIIHETRVDTNQMIDSSIIGRENEYNRI